MNRLLWVVYRIGEIAPEALLKAIEASFAIDWEKAPTTTGIALALLSDMADQNPSRVFQLLPKSLDAYEWWTRALLSEMLVYAWWCCAEHIPDTRANLKAHTKPDIAAIPDEYRIFALRGSAIALMGMMCLDMAIPSNELSGKQASYPLGTLLFFYLNGDDFTRRHRQAFQNHPQFEQLRASLQACVYEEERISVHPFQKELSNARYLCARSCREILRNFDGDETWVAQREHQESIIYAVFRLFGTGRDAEFMQLVKASPHDLLGLLETSIRDDALLPTFYYWKEETHSWYSLLIARVYARMFNVNPIGDAEAYELCEQMLVAMSALPDGSERRAYEAIYGAIAHQLKGDISPLPLLPAPKGLLQNAHAYALSILQRAHEQQEATWIADALDDRRGWWDTTRFQLNDQSHSLGDHKYFLYVFPAVRLAFITAGKRYTWDDPASQFMKARVQVNKLQEEHWRVFRNDPPVGRDRLQKALAIFNEQLERFPHDERLWQSCANLLLRLGRCQEAKNLLLHCLSMSSCSQDTQADAYYDLACVYAKMGNEDECRHMLQVSIQYRPLNQLSCNWLIHDPDLESVREKAWFRALQQAQG